MGMLVEGVWKDIPRDSSKTGGEFIRTESLFRDRITADGSSGFKAEAGRYHLYVSLSCPWAHRTVIFRALKGLEQAITISMARPISEPKGWAFAERPGSVTDAANGARYLYEVYVKARPDYTGRVTVPTLWDRQRAHHRQQRVLGNHPHAEPRVRCVTRRSRCPTCIPQRCAAEIDRWNELIYRTVNNGVYRAGFATAQDKYEQAVRNLFATFDTLDRHLAGNRYLCGERFTEADWRLFTTLVRFDLGLPLPFQVQSASPAGLSEPVGVHAGPLPISRGRGDGRSQADQGALLRQPDAG